MSFAILGMGTAVPAPRYSQEKTATGAAQVAARTEKGGAARRPLSRQPRLAHRHLAPAPPYLGALGGDELVGVPRRAAGAPAPAGGMAEYAQAAPPLATEASR